MILAHSAHTPLWPGVTYAENNHTFQSSGEHAHRPPGRGLLNRCYQVAVQNEYVVAYYPAHGQQLKPKRDDLLLRHCNLGARTHGVMSGPSTRRLLRGCASQGQGSFGRA